MSASPEPVTVPDVEPIPLTIAALTAAARHTYLAPAGPDAAGETPGSGTRAPFSDIASYVLAAVAANVGGLQSLLSAEVDTAHADQVRQIVTGVVGEDEIALLTYRTEPLRLTLDVADVFHDLGLEDMFDDEIDAVRDPGSSGGAPGVSSVDAPVLDGVDVDALVQRMEELLEQDYSDYLVGYEQTAESVLAEYGAGCSVHVVDAEDEEPEPRSWDALSDAVHATTHRRSPLPMTGQAPDWSDGTPADAVRRAGLTYTMRALLSLELG